VNKSTRLFTEGKVHTALASSVTVGVASGFVEGSAAVSFNEELVSSKSRPFLITHLSRLYLGGILVLQIVLQREKVRIKEKSYRRLGSLLRLRDLHSGDRGLGNRLSRLDLLHGGNRGGNSFRGRHYKIEENLN
jgi:hypothetical protein